MIKTKDLVRARDGVEVFRVRAGAVTRLRKFGGKFYRVLPTDETTAYATAWPNANQCYLDERSALLVAIGERDEQIKQAIIGRNAVAERLGLLNAASRRGIALVDAMRSADPMGEHHGKNL